MTPDDVAAGLIDVGDVASLAEAITDVVPGMSTWRFTSLPRAGGFLLGLTGDGGEFDVALRGSTAFVEHLSLSASNGHDEDEPDPRGLKVVRATLDWARPRGVTRIVVGSHWRRTHETMHWVRAGALPCPGGHLAMTSAISFNLDALSRRGRIGEACMALARKLEWRMTGEPHLLRALAAMSDPVRGHRGPTLGHAALRGATWPVEIDLAEPSTARIFAGARGDGARDLAREAYRGSGREAMEREGFSPEEIRQVWG